MSSTVTYEIDCATPAATETFGRHLGLSLRGGEVIELAGDIGAGKTTFVKGLAKGVGSTDHVSSPTFTVSLVYNGRLKLHHLDLYRLDEPGLLSHQLAEAMEEADSVVVIEWGGGVAGILPDDRIVINFAVTAGEGRRLTATVPKNKEYIQC